MSESQKELYELYAKLNEVATNVVALGRLIFFGLGLFLQRQMLDWVGNSDNTLIYAFCLLIGFGGAAILTRGLGFRGLFGRDTLIF